jgi:hypothetical protein
MRKKCRIQCRTEARRKIQRNAKNPHPTLSEGEGFKSFSFGEGFRMRRLLTPCLRAKLYYVLEITKRLATFPVIKPTIIPTIAPPNTSPG